MYSRDFAYWLQGFAELNTEPPTAEQWQVIRNHLNLVFKHELDTPDPTGQLQATHDGTVKPPKPDLFVYPPPRDPLIRC